PDVEEVRGDTYGGLKVLCEQAFRETFGDAAALVRLGLMVGPHDHTGRFTYWPERLARGGEVLGPGSPTRRVQFIDVRDLAAFLLDLGERRTKGTFNATGPKGELTFGGLLSGAADALGVDVHVTWVDDDTLLAAGVTPFVGVPLWLPAGAPTGMLAVSIERALAAGLTLRPWEETVRDTLEWVTEARGSADYAAPEGVGLSPEQERELLARF
ncbi:MAG TPA: hypothetical protein VGA36_06630, partial [Nitriliruptorales bacterium]